MSAERHGWERGVRVGIDVGTARVGVAVSDPDGILATPLETVQRPRVSDSTGVADNDLRRIAEIVREYAAVDVIVGQPRTLAGRSGAAEKAAAEYAARVAQAVAPVPVHRVDERFSTVAASRSLTASGVKGRRQRAVVDAAAAALILQTWLDRHRGRS